MLKKGKMFEKLDKNSRRETKFGNFFQKGQKGHLQERWALNRSPAITKTTMKIKNTSYLLTW